MKYHTDKLHQDTAISECSQFKSLGDVHHNLRSLDKRKVYIWYVPSETILDIKVHSKTLESRIYLLSKHLKYYGFDVKVDLVDLFGLLDEVCHISEDNWASWSGYQMSRADWIICVCSRSLYEMFYNASDKLDILTLCTRASLLNKQLYDRLVNDYTSKVIPVILQEDDDNVDFVPPTLRHLEDILRIFEKTPLDARKLDGDFEQLIYRMAGIYRMGLISAEDNHRQGFVKLPLPS